MSQVIAPPPINRKLRPGQDIDIMGCRRHDPDGAAFGEWVVGVRWGVRPDLGYPFPRFPESGFRVFREEGGSRTPLNNGNPFVLPRSSSWQDFRSDARARKPVLGPWFHDIIEDELGFLLPLLQLADPRTPSPWDTIIEKVAIFLGEPHLFDPQMETLYWPGGAPRSVTDLFSDPQINHKPIILFYGLQARMFLEALALRFEYAVLFGLATDDQFPEPNVPIKYSIKVSSETASGGAESDPILQDSYCNPGGVTGFRASTQPGSVRHPAFDHTVQWDWPKELVPKDFAQRPNGLDPFAPRSPARFTGLKWDAHMDDPARLLSRGAVLYEIRRYCHGAATAALQDSPPAIPDDAVFEEINPGELVICPESELGLLDQPGMTWPPFEGWYRYRIWGVDLLGVYSPNHTETSIRQADDLPPAKPNARLISENTMTFGKDDTAVSVDLRVDWGPPEDFLGPDTTRFRVSASFVGRRSVGVVVKEITAVGSEYPSRIRLRLDGLVPPLDRYAGTTMTTETGGWRIHSPDPLTSNTLIAHLSAGRAPKIGQDGVIIVAEPETANLRLLEVPRRPVVIAHIDSVPSLDPLQFQFTVDQGTLPVDETVEIYLHALRLNVIAKWVAGTTWEIDIPREAKHDEVPDPVGEEIRRWLGLTSSPESLILDSPVLVFPRTQISVKVPLPVGFYGGLLNLKVTAADDTVYVESPAPPLDGVILKGNESDSTDLAISISSTVPINPPTILNDPNKIVWAESATQFDENARYKLAWGNVSGAAQYQVWRVLEPALLPKNVVAGSLSDAELLLLAQAAPSSVFELRSRFIISNHYTDKLPGRAPTRAFYCISVVSESGVEGPLSAPIGPVRVPDIRRPPSPNIVSISPRKIEPEQIGNDEIFSDLPPELGIPEPQKIPEPRALEVTWEQPGPLPDLRYEIEAQDESGQWSVVASTTVNPVPVKPDEPNRFSINIGNLTPGFSLQFRVYAIRIALDPIDPYGSLTRDISGAYSQTVGGRAVGPLLPPSLNSVIYDDASGKTTLVWSNSDRYSVIRIGRKAPERHRFEWIKDVSGDSKLIVIDETLSTGTWIFKLRAEGGSRSILSKEIEVKV